MAKEKHKEEKKKHAGHGFTHTHIEHHSDGSHTIHHQHEDGSHADVKHAVSNLDGVHDSLQDNMGQPNPGEAEANAGEHGVPAPVAGPAGLSAPGAPGGMPGQGA